MRLFTAVWPPPPIRGALEALPKPQTQRIRWTAPDAWHVTLAFHGDDADLKAEIHRMDAAPLPAEPVTASLGPRLGRFGNRVLHVPVRGLDELAACFGAEAGFQGHLTIARAAGTRLADLTGREIHGSWPVTEVTLVRSHVGGPRSTYEVMHRRELP